MRALSPRCATARLGWVDSHYRRKPFRKSIGKFVLRSDDERAGLIYVAPLTTLLDCRQTLVERVSHLETERDLLPTFVVNVTPFPALDSRQTFGKARGLIILEAV